MAVGKKCDWCKGDSITTIGSFSGTLNLCEKHNYQNIIDFLKLKEDLDNYQREKKRLSRVLFEMLKSNFDVEYYGDKKVVVKGPDFYYRWDGESFWYEDYDIGLVEKDPMEIFNDEIEEEFKKKFWEDSYDVPEVLKTENGIHYVMCPHCGDTQDMAFRTVMKMCTKCNMVINMEPGWRAY